MSIPDLPHLTLDDMGPELRAEVEPNVERLGYLGEFVQVFGAIPGVIPAFMAYTRAVKAPLSNAENELLALTVCSALDDHYELIQHERLSARLGFSPDWIAAAQGRSGGGDPVLNETESVLRELALAVVERHGADCAAQAEKVLSVMGPEKLAASLLQITRFMTIATLCNTLSLTLPVPSIFDPLSKPLA